METSRKANTKIAYCVMRNFEKKLQNMYVYVYVYITSHKSAHVGTSSTPEHSPDVLIIHESILSAGHILLGDKSAENSCLCLYRVIWAKWTVS